MHFAAFLAVAAVVIATPGPDTALTIRNTLLGGRPSGIFTALGVAGGQLTWTVATSTGLAALLAASQPVFDALRLVGAAYLVYLGVQALVSVLHSDENRRTKEPVSPRQSLRAIKAFRQGLISNLSNPKMVAFFPALLPQFAPSGRGVFWNLLLLGLLFCLMTLSWLTGYAIAVARAGDFIRRPRIRHALEALSGAVLIALGFRLATSSTR